LTGVADASTVIVAGGHDHPVAASAIRRMDPDARVDSMGTANLIYCEAADTAPRLDPYLAFSLPVRGGTGVACLGVFEFAAALAPLGDLGAFLSAPRLAGEPSPMPPPATPAGIGECGDRRAALEACSMFARRMLDAASDAGAPPGTIHATGGWTRSRALIELRASVFGEAVTVVDEVELTAVAAALIGAEAAGASLPLQAAARRRVIEPLQAWARHYAAIYGEYRACLDGMVASSKAEASPNRPGTPRP
jgi:xylulokinase